MNLLELSIGHNLRDYPVPPFTKWLNGTIIEVSRGVVIVEFETRQEMANPANILHGGAQSAMIDDTIGIACATLGYKGFLITIDFHIDYLGRVSIGTKVQVKAKIVRERKQIIHAEAEIFSPEGFIIAKAGANLMRTQIEPNYAKSELYENQNMG
jgi:acyl-coenzyme A thioesterase 13